ncbi:acyl-CoA dehydrogenase family protein [Couchioplanes azureus]|uniref:acyl-CoA dehydrogenase family protein n=1 Tax=Couchioplanes caeruleus TaxID=56438 RepID=UPI00166FF734|nr:acyl-CoA dehydrogenase family protein [Couchioplanes caeruleus]GGQ72442.1 acyl-CoA dehydrogenase [Couchioplanes caeruleus subsp. azureus]
MGPDFELDEAQEAIVRLAGEVLDDGAGTPDRLGKALGEAGLLTLAVPERLGGAGLGLLENALVITEIARRGVAIPALSTLGPGVLPVVRWADPDRQRDLLAGVGGGRILTAALAEPGDPLPAGPRTTASARWTVTGTKTGVPDAEQAHRILVPVTRETGGLAVALVDPAAPGVTLRRTATSSGCAEFTVRMDAVAAEPLAPGGRCVADLHRCAVAAACAAGDGALAGALRLTAGHVRDRQQFGRPLATFQAVAQQIADVYVTSRTLHLAVLAACWGLDAQRGDDDARADDDLWIAAYWLTSEALAALRSCHHLHGGLGLAADYPLHRYGALLRDLARRLGGAEHCLHRLGGRVVHRPV